VIVLADLALPYAEPGSLLHLVLRIASVFAYRLAILCAFLGLLYHAPAGALPRETLSMCHLIHIGLPEAYADAVPAGREPHVERQTNPSVSAAFGAGFAQFSVSLGGCSCGLYASPEAEARESNRPYARRQKYERMGWSKAKIDRAVAAMEEAAQSHTVMSGLRDAAAKLVADLAEWTGEVRLIVHEYRGSFAEERVQPRGTRRLTAAELRGIGRYDVLEDMLYVIAGVDSR
jgi:hypothetical protein